MLLRYNESMTQKSKYAEHLEAGNEALQDKNEKLIQLIDDITGNKAVRQEEVINLDVALASWLIPRLKMFLKHTEQENNKKRDKNIMEMIDGFMIVVDSKKYPTSSSEDLKRLDRALELLRKGFSGLWI